MARAKRTDRTEARRRFRASQVAVAADPEAAALLAEAKGTADAKSVPAAAPRRPSITTAFRAAYRPVDLREDLRALPQIVTHWGFLVASGASILAAVAFIVVNNEFASSVDFSQPNPLAGQEVGMVFTITYAAASLVLAPPPAAGAFIVGFTAPRASWLGGLIYGLIATACYSFVLLSPAGRLLTAGNPPDAYVANAWAVSPIGAMLFAAASAWYKRFLNLANPNRGSARKPAKPVQGRGNAKPNSRAASGR